MMKPCRDQLAHHHPAYAQVPKKMQSIVCKFMQLIACFNLQNSNPNPFEAWMPQGRTKGLQIWFWLQLI